jgi:AcrR family transcriptional regulator
MFALGPDGTRIPSYSGDVIARRKSTADSPPRRRRRTPEEAEREIIDAAESLLRERPFRELTVDEVMQRTELSRPSFYVYFRDRHELVLRVVEHLGGELFTTSERWFAGEGDGATLAREAVEGIVGVFDEHGPVLRALADAAVHDPGVEEAYGSLVQRFVDATARHIEHEIAAGRILPLDPEQTAKALVWMMERYLNLSLSRPPTTPSPVVAETLATIVGRVLYGTR